MSQLPQDTIQILPSNSSRRRVKRYKIIFITGNPGLINYYEKFLIHLHALLSSSKANAEFTVCGSSLIGFEVGDGKKAWKNAGVAHDAPFNLAEVIDAAEKNVIRCIEDDSDCGVVLVGHSVGAFIALEIIQRHRRRLEAGNEKGKEGRIVGGICLFPTVVDIGKSERGVVLTKISKMPLFPLVLPLLISIILTIIPTLLLRPLVRLFTGFQPHSVDTTTAFLKSKHGVHQALYMGADEMRAITTNKWDTEIWGAAHPSPSGIPRPKLFFYFGKDDHWVAERTRDDLMELRGRKSEDGEEWKPRMEIDGLGIPHAFPDAFSIPIAEKVKEYVEEIVVADGR